MKTIKILLIDDDEIIQLTYTELLQRLGFAVYSAYTAQQAIDTFTTLISNKTYIDVAIIDLNIPGGIGGEIIVKRLKQIHPSFKAIASSGYPDSPILKNYSSYQFDAIIEKPYKVEQMRDLITSLLNI